MTDRKIPCVKIEEKGFYIKYNGVGILATRPNKSKQIFHVQLYKLTYNLDDSIETEEPMGNPLRSQDLGDKQVRRCLAERVRMATQHRPSNYIFDAHDEERVFDLLAKYSGAEKQENRGNYAGDPYQGYREQQRRRAIDSYVDMFKRPATSSIEEKLKGG